MKKGYFAQSEFECPCCRRVKVDKELLEKLNELRELCGFPLVVNSGYRCSNYNEKIGSKVNSAHIKGQAADISCTDSQKRFLILQNAFKVGFKRIGIGNSFIHLDVSEELPQGVIWGYK